MKNILSAAELKNEINYILAAAKLKTHFDGSSENYSAFVKEVMTESFIRGFVNGLDYASGQRSGGNK